MEHVALIYKFLVLSNLITQLNGVVQNLGLPPSGIAHPSQLREWEVWIDDRASPAHEARSYLRTDQYHFVLDGVALYICRLDENGLEAWPDVFSQQGTSKTNVSAQLAFQLATNWLTLAGVDVPALEAKHKVEVEQGHSNAKGESMVSPNFYVRWGIQKTEETRPGAVTPEPVAEVKLDAARKWLVSLSLLDLSFWRGSRPFVTNAWALSLLPDEPVVQMLSKPGIDYTNSFVLLDIRPDYEQSRRRQLLGELTRLVRVLELDTVNILTEVFDTAYVNPPAFGRGGVFRSSQLTARFNQLGNLSSLDYLPHPHTNALLLVQEPSLIDSNAAYAIAREKLTALNVDWERLSRELKFRAEHRRLTFKQDGVRVSKPTAEFSFYWGKEPTGQGLPEVKVSVNGAIRKIVHLAVSDSSYLHSLEGPANKPAAFPVGSGRAPPPNR